MQSWFQKLIGVSSVASTEASLKEVWLHLLRS
jgi:hypothetical protein